MGVTRVPSGVPGLDPLIEGGFPEGKSYLITGDPGTGKSIFCLQVLLQGLVDGEKAVYVAVDEKPADVIDQAASLGLDLAPYLEKKLLVILDASPFFAGRRSAGKEREIDVAKTVADLASYVKRMEAARVVIDPVGPLIGAGGSAERMQEHARVLVHSLQVFLKSTNLFTSYRTPGIRDEGNYGAEEFLVAGVIVLRVAKADKRFYRTLMVQKMRATALELREHEFAITADKGIVVDTSGGARL